MVTHKHVEFLLDKVNYSLTKLCKSKKEYIFLNVTLANINTFHTKRQTCFKIYNLGKCF